MRCMVRRTGQRRCCLETEFDARRRRCSPCSSAAGTCAPRGTTASAPPRGSNTRPSGRRSRADSWPAGRARPSPADRRPQTQRSHRGRRSSGRSCRPPGRRSAPRTDARGQTSGSPTASPRTTTRHSSSRTHPYITTHQTITASPKHCVPQ